jgi:hypothetical protein
MVNVTHAAEKKADPVTKEEDITIVIDQQGIATICDSFNVPSLEQ